MYQTLGQRLRQYARLAVGRVTGSCTHENGAYNTLLAIEEGRLVQRAELTAVSRILVGKGVCSLEELQKAMTEEMSELLTLLAREWPEIEVEPMGRSFTITDVQALAARSKREGWPP